MPLSEMIAPQLQSSLKSFSQASHSLQSPVSLSIAIVSFMWWLLIIENSSPESISRPIEVIL
jgi:hypothetical protein